MHSSQSGQASSAVGDWKILSKQTAEFVSQTIIFSDLLAHFMMS